MKTLREAAQDVIDRWETPLWKDVPHTAEYIYRLRDALAEPELITEADEEQLMRIALMLEHIDPYGELDQEPFAWFDPLETKNRWYTNISNVESNIKQRLIPLYTKELDDN